MLSEKLRQFIQGKSPQAITWSLQELHQVSCETMVLSLVTDESRLPQLNAGLAALVIWGEPQDGVETSFFGLRKRVVREEPAEAFITFRPGELRAHWDWRIEGDELVFYPMLRGWWAGQNVEKIEQVLLREPYLLEKRHGLPEPVVKLPICPWISEGEPSYWGILTTECFDSEVEGYVAPFEERLRALRTPA